MAALLPSTRLRKVSSARSRPKGRTWPARAQRDSNLINAKFAVCEPTAAVRMGSRLRSVFRALLEYLRCARMADFVFFERRNSKRTAHKQPCQYPLEIRCEFTSTEVAVAATAYHYLSLEHTDKATADAASLCSTTLCKQQPRLLQKLLVLLQVPQTIKARTNKS